MSRSSQFYQALEYVYFHEGGYSNEPADRGGKTKYGITEQVWRDFYGGVPPYKIENITRLDAEDVYWKNYWAGARLERLERDGVGQWLLNQVFDAVVNHGAAGGSKMLQRAYNTVRYESDPPLKEDGVLGPVSSAAIVRFVRTATCMSALVAALRVERGILFKELVVGDAEQRTFIRGWMARLT